MGSGSPRDATETRRQLAELIGAGDIEAALEFVDELAGERDQLAGERDQLAGERDQLAGERDQLAGERDQLAERVDQQSKQIKWMIRLRFGRRSEKLSAEELGQLLLAYGSSETDANAPDPTLPVGQQVDIESPEQPRKLKKKRSGHRGRTKLSEELERIVTEVRVPDDERACHGCGNEMGSFGHVEHERVEYVPAKLQVHVERREKLGCKKCGADATTAERAESKRKLRAGPSLLAHLIEAKCDDALPLHRQCDQLGRLGFELPPSTAYGYFTYATDLLLPVSDALLGTVLESPDWVGIDDTRLDVLDRTKGGGKYRGHLWCFRGSQGLVAYTFTKTWEAAEVAPWFRLVAKETHVQVDDYKGYSSVLPTPDGKDVPVVDPARRLGCMMHVRRRFYKALELEDARAAKPIAWIKTLYEVEKKARGRPPDERLALRKEESLPVLDAFDAWVDERALTLGKTGALVEAVRYAKQQRPYIRRCFTDGRFEIDNGACERAIREPALGRKNFLFTGSAEAAERLAGAYSLVQTCRAIGIDTRVYLTDVIDKLERGWPARRLVELLPQRWSADLRL